MAQGRGRGLGPPDGWRAAKDGPGGGMVHSMSKGADVVPARRAKRAALCSVTRKTSHGVNLMGNRGMARLLAQLYHGMQRHIALRPLERAAVSQPWTSEVGTMGGVTPPSQQHLTLADCTLQPGVASEPAVLYAALGRSRS